MAPPIATPLCPVVVLQRILEQSLSFLQSLLKAFVEHVEALVDVLGELGRGRLRLLR